MKITKDHIGDVICIFSTGQRMLVTDISDQYFSYDLENGLSFLAKGFSVQGGVERAAQRVKSFHSNHDLAKALDAAELAALRRLDPSREDVEERAEASEVLSVADKQRTALKARMQKERETMKAGTELADQFLNVLQQDASHSGDFFGVSASFSDTDGTYLIDGKSVRSREEALLWLSGLTIARPKAASLESVLATANERAINQDRNKTSRSPEPDR